MIKKNNTLFFSDSGARCGSFYQKYEPYEGEELEWAIEARKRLED